MTTAYHYQHHYQRNNNHYNNNNVIPSKRIQQNNDRNMVLQSLLFDTDEHMHTTHTDITNSHQHQQHKLQHYRSSPVINQKNSSTSNKRLLRHSLTRQGYSFDSGLATTNFQDKSLNFFERRQALLTSTPTRLRKSSSILRDIIIESISENNNMGEVNESSERQNNNSTSYKNGINTSESTKSTSSTKSSSKKAGYIRDPKKVYRHRKHHSDYGIVFLQVEDSFDRDNDDINEADTMATPTTTRSRTMSCSTDDHDEHIIGGGLKVGDTPSKLHSKSDSNLEESGVFNRSCRSPKSNSHVDITSTQMYKDIYADNLRQYGFLLAKVSIDRFLSFSFLDFFFHCPYNN